MKTQEADQLIARFLSREADPGEIEALQHWRNQSSDHEALFQQYSTIWKQAKLETHAIDEEAAWKQVQGNMRKSSGFRMSFVRIAAAVLVFSIAGWFGYQKVYNPLITVTTALHEQKEVKLPDGSQVWLNENSTLSYHKQLSGVRRDVALEGEAYFDVVKNPGQPFTITSAHAITTVLGTTFNLDTRNEEVILDVFTGKVRLQSADHQSEVFVEAGARGIIQGGKASEAGSLDQNSIAWKQRELQFNDATLTEVCKAIEDYFDVKITVDHDAIYACHFTGKFTKPTLKGVLDVMGKALQLSYTIEQQKVVLSGKGCGQ